MREPHRLGTFPPVPWIGETCGGGAGKLAAGRSARADLRIHQESVMNNIIWIVGAVVIVLVILSLLGLR